MANQQLIRYNEMVKILGRSALSYMYPKDFEFYLCAFELMEGRNVVDYFVFPIQPSSIQKTEPNRTNIKTSLSGVTVLKNDAFIPQEVSIKGNFGRNFKILQMQGVAFSNNVEIDKERGLTFNSQNFSYGVKTGFGATKILQKIIQKSNETTSTGQMRQLHFYNLALGESYLVTVQPNGLTLSQTQDMNMIWQYSLSMSILAPLSEVMTSYFSEKRNQDIMMKGVLQKSVNIVARDLATFINKVRN